MVAQVAQQGNHDVGGVSAVEQPARRRAEGGRSQRAAVASESAPARCRGVSRHARAFGRTARTKRWADSRATSTSDTFYRRAIYGRISRARPPQVLALYDFPEATQTAPDRDVTTTTLQQIFLMNSAFIQNLAEAAAKTAASGDRRGRADRRAVSPDSRARSNGRRDEERAGVSAEGHAAALRAGAAVDQRGDFPSMSFKLTRRQMIEQLGGGLGVVGLAGVFARLVAERRSRRGPWQLCRPGAAGAKGQARHHALHERRAVAARHVRSQAGAVQVRRPASERGGSAHRARRPAACCRRRSSSSATDGTASR